MVVSSRAIVAVGLSLAVLGLRVGPAHGQAPPDNAVRRAAATASPAAPAVPKTPAPAIIGWVDMTAVFKGYDRVKFNSEEFKKAVMDKEGELKKFQDEAMQEQQMLAKMTPGSVDYKKHEDKITSLKAQYEAARESAQREFTLREAEMLGALYKDISSMVARVAQFRGMTFVVRVNNDQFTAANPNAAMMAIERDVIYADPALEVTRDVVMNLNREYKAKGGGSAKTTSSTATPASSSMPPRGN